TRSSPERATRAHVSSRRSRSTRPTAASRSDSRRRSPEMFVTLPALPPGLNPRDAFTRFENGLDLESPSWTSQPGDLRDCLNYEVAVEGGYRDIAGYERFDGRSKPSEASFTI